MRVVVIGHTYIVKENRGKLQAMAQMPDPDLTLISPTTWKEPDFGERNFEPESHLDTISMPIKLSGQVRRYFFSPIRFADVLKSVVPHVVHVEAEVGSYVSFQTILAKKRLGFKLTHFVWDNITALNWRYRHGARLGYKFIDHLFCGSNSALNTAIKQGYSGRATVLPQIGIDYDKIESLSANDPWEGRPGFRVGYVGRLTREKGVDLLIQAIAQTPDTLLSLVGDGVYAKNLVAQAENLGIADRIKFIGAVPHNQVFSWIKGFDALVLPSRTTPGWAEQFGHVLIEAMACKVPVIGSDSGVIPEVIGETGLVFTEGDVDSLSAKILELKNRPELARQFSEVGVKRVQSEFSNRTIAEKIVGVWSDLIDR